MSQHEPELLPGARLPTTTLTGQAERLYTDRLVRILRAARLNLYYPDARAMGAHLQALQPDVHQGLYDGVELNLKSGLPSYKEWTRVQTDVAIAQEQLNQLGPRDALARKAEPGTIHARQLKKHDYYKALLNRPTSSLGDMSVALRRIDPQAKRAWFHVVLDKLDASGLFVRYAIDLSQESSVWNKPVVTLSEENAQHTREFQSLIYKFTSLDAEFTWAKLRTIAGLDVERVAKGVIGPFYFAPEQAPSELGALWPAQPGQDFIAMFSLDMIAEDLTEDRNNDPFSRFFSEQLSEAASQVYDQARQQHNHHRFKDRKFVTTRALQPALAALCATRDTKNIIYTI